VLNYIKDPAFDFFVCRPYSCSRLRLHFRASSALLRSSPYHPWVSELVSNMHCNTGIAF